PMSIQLAGKEACLQKGVDALAKMTAGKVYVGCAPDAELSLKGCDVNTFAGPHPAGNVGVQIEKISPVNKGETVWAMGADTVCKIGHLFNNNTLDFGCCVAVGGSCVAQARFVKATEGESLRNLLDGNLQGEVEAMRIVSGNLLTGVKETIDGYLHFPYRTVSVIPEINEEIEFLGWARLGKNKYSFGHTFATWLGSKASHRFDARINGGERAIIMAGEYDKVQPMDIYSEFLIKAILARDIEKMEQLGIYEVAPEDFALCEFIDTSKLELQRIVREGLDYLRKELN
ncbi:MAG: NADH:ubiquinone reductase (Na(+)-transporting) subunit A, partial [Bacteroidales bacterium]|nr:NADH:ubiquinone reductase (Na(+)-transporting) subunit A [Bacteroidales bacterium]